jgi:hypothetical protein
LYLCFQNFVEVDPSFHKKYLSELKEDWFVINKGGKYHKLKCNCYFSFPQIIEGWEELKNFEQFPENVEVVFAYGGNIFEIIAIKEINSSDEILGFHSRSVLPKENIWFDVPLTQPSTKEKKLIK